MCVRHKKTCCIHVLICLSGGVYDGFLATTVHHGVSVAAWGNEGFSLPPRLFPPIVSGASSRFPTCISPTSTTMGGAAAASAVSAATSLLGFGPATAAVVAYLASVAASFVCGAVCCCYCF